MPSCYVCYFFTVKIRIHGTRVNSRCTNALCQPIFYFGPFIGRAWTAAIFRFFFVGNGSVQHIELWADFPSFFIIILVGQLIVEHGSPPFVASGPVLIFAVPVSPKLLGGLIVFRVFRFDDLTLEPIIGYFSPNVKGVVCHVIPFIVGIFFLVTITDPSTAVPIIRFEQSHSVLLIMGSECLYNRFPFSVLPLERCFLGHVTFIIILIFTFFSYIPIIAYTDVELIYSQSITQFLFVICVNISCTHIDFRVVDFLCQAISVFIPGISI